MKERTEVSENMKWDLSSLYRSEKDFNDDLEYLSNNYTKYKEYEKTSTKKIKRTTIDQTHNTKTGIIL